MVPSGPCRSRAERRAEMSPRRLAPLLILGTILAGLTSTAAADRMSGLYVDNGFDQTIVHRVVSQREKREVEHEILNLLGLPDRPRNTAGRPPQVKRSAPKFLLDIYKNALGEDEDEKPIGEQQRRAGEFDLTGQDLRAIDQSDVIMTFAAHNHHVPGVRHERGKRLWFDVSEVPPGEHIISAELRLYRSMDVKNRRNRGSYMITAYRVLRTEDGTRELQYVDAVNTTTGKEGWLTLNVSEPLDHWVNNPDGNKGLYLSVHPADRSVHEMRPEDIGIVGFRGDPDKQPFMVGYFKSSGIRESKVRQKRDARRRKKSESSSLDYRNNPYTDPGVQYNSRTCKIQTLYVSFRDLKWQDWIIAPDGYDAYYCSGECNFPLNAHMNATNHAIVQTLVHLVSPGKVPKPCCAPTKLSPISVLYFLDESNVILKKYKNMVVKSCGCH
ncbi:protein 60A [Bombus vosnesenskii]|uniref:Protein 60A n=3 Tax=Pyrobombus TaxID=144703 RepID=A0A6J3KJ79_9HYME|nr:protein 60A [Bombus impatiens]XP_033188478.1 protein 60A [Bombus vancouverensis nearcticus]XP_033307135.1 protein 60A [Bombus bifarius]XP_033353217.1 protein 60A [Bombus vosnesenskii]XP_043604334.1 protein 60A isoform X1 [Bombus pyrosoma]XP_050482957.1 protein 60A [Bombus huntii]XP_050584345.1 protein 60A [Bombus affinis]XP_060822689.1 protein 60A isoform X1 [Bombus pascuorum]